MNMRIGWLFPTLMNTYGDSGNVAAIKRRCELRGITAQVYLINRLSEIDDINPDLIIIGGAQDKDEECVACEIVSNLEVLPRALQRGAFVFAVCAGYQLLGDSYTTASGRKLHGFNVVEAHTVFGQSRSTGYAIVQSALLNVGIIVGFENHSGRTYLGAGVAGLGTVISGCGNNGIDHTEGIATENIIGTYLHGPVLIANPALADYVIIRALRRKSRMEIAPLEDTWETAVHELMLARARKRRVAATA